MITDWEQALRAYNDFRLYYHDEGENVNHLRNDLTVYKPTDPVPMGGKLIEHFLFEEYEGGYRCFPAYRDGTWWSGPNDDRLGGDGLLDRELCRTDEGTIEQAVDKAESKIQKVFING